jgi:hypothetical protein
MERSTRVVLMGSSYVYTSNGRKGSLGPATLRSLAEESPKVGPEIDTGLHRRPLTDFFLKGPIPLAELAPVAKMPGKTLALWLLIVYRVTFARKTCRPCENSP